MIKKLLIEKNFEIKTNRKIEYIVIHYTAGSSSRKGQAENTRNYFNTTTRQASAHYIVDDAEIIQAVEDENVAWHCGTNKGYKHPHCRNSNSIGIEMCSNHKAYNNNTPATDSGWFFTEETINNAVKLVKFLMDKYNIGVDNVIMHYDVTGKICPAPFINGGTWGEFKKRLIKTDRYDKIEDMPIWCKDIIKWYVEKGYITGNSKGDLNLSYDMIRLLVIIKRMKGDVV